MACDRRLRFDYWRRGFVRTNQPNKSRDKRARLEQVSRIDEERVSFFLEKSKDLDMTCCSREANRSIAPRTTSVRRSENVCVIVGRFQFVEILDFSNDFRFF